MGYPVAQEPSTSSRGEVGTGATRSRALELQPCGHNEAFGCDTGTTTVKPGMWTGQAGRQEGNTGPAGEPGAEWISGWQVLCPRTRALG